MESKRLIIIAAAAAAAVLVYAQDPDGGAQRGRNIAAYRPAVPGVHGLVTAGHPLAAMAGLQVLMKGGNAVDAAVAVGAALNMMEPQMNGVGGNDNLSLDETNGPLPAASIFGGDGNDVLIGGDGNDFIDGSRGNDVAFLGAGDDTFRWDPGDGSDTVEGEAGHDTMRFNGSNASENFDISANGSRVRLSRDVGNVSMDLNGIEVINLNVLGGADTITDNDLTDTDVTQLN